MPSADAAHLDAWPDERDQLVGDRQAITRRERDHHRSIVFATYVGDERDQIEVDAARHDHGHLGTVGIATQRDTWLHLVESAARDRRRGYGQLGQVDDTGVSNEQPSQEALASNPVERVLRRVRYPLLGHVGDHPGKCVGRRLVAVQQAERISVLGADTNLESRHAIVAVDTAAHLESVHLTGDDAVLDDEVSTSVRDLVGERQMRSDSLRWHRQRFFDDRQQLAFLGKPHLDRQIEAGSSPCQNAAVDRRDDVQARRLLTDRPGQCRAERPRRAGATVPIDEHPRISTIVARDVSTIVARDDHTGADRKWRAGSLGRYPTVFRDQPTQLRIEQTCPARGRFIELRSFACHAPNAIEPAAVDTPTPSASAPGQSPPA